MIVRSERINPVLGVYFQCKIDIIEDSLSRYLNVPSFASWSNNGDSQFGSHDPGARAFPGHEVFLFPIVRYVAA